MLARIKNFLLWPWTQYKIKKLRKKRMEELRKRDPFIYE